MSGINRLGITGDVIRLLNISDGAVHTTYMSNYFRIDSFVSKGFRQVHITCLFEIDVHPPLLQGTLSKV